MWQLEHYRRLVRISALYDLLATAAFATPWTFQLLHQQLLGIAQVLHLPGELPLFAPMHVLIANLMGSIVCVWAVLRLHQPQVLLGRYDGVARLLFASWMAYALAHGASTLIVGFLVLEVGFAVAQLWPLRR